MSCYKLIEAQKRTNFPVQFMCRMLGISRSGYYDWRDREPSGRSLENAALTERIREIHDRSIAAARPTDLRGYTLNYCAPSESDAPERGWRG